jgi:hypothetical protein
MAQDVIEVTVPRVPVTAPGAGMADLLKYQTLTVKSNRVLFSDTTAINLIQFRGNELVLDAKINVTAAFDGTGTSAAATATISVPGSTGAVVIWDAGALGLGTLTSDFMLSSTNTGPVKVPASGGYLTVAYTPNTTTAGSFEIYLRYIPDESRL